MKTYPERGTPPCCCFPAVWYDWLGAGNSNPSCNVCELGGLLPHHTPLSHTYIWYCRDTTHTAHTQDTYPEPNERRGPPLPEEKTPRILALSASLRCENAYPRLPSRRIPVIPLRITRFLRLWHCGTSSRH